MKSKSFWLGLLLGISTLTANDAFAELGTCDDAGILDGSMITDIPWDSMFPIRLAGVTISPSGEGRPANSTNKVMCACEDDLGFYVPGFTQSMWEPARLIELVRSPNCMMTLGGSDIELTDGRMRGSTGQQDQYGGETAAFWHYHYYAFPLLLMLEMVLPSRCGDGYLSMDLLYLSEIDPTWTDSELAFFANPEAAIFSNPISIAACIADSAAALVGDPLDELFWCAGAWGEMYPFSGYVSGKSSVPTKTSLLATRSVGALHRRLLARQTVGDDALCSAPIFPTIPKSQYKMNMMYPVAERGQSTVQTESSDGTIQETVVGSGGAHVIGEPSVLWGEWRNIPSKEDAVYMLWRYNDCCSSLY